MVDNRGQNCNQMDWPSGGDKQWFTIDKTNGPGHGFQYQSSDGADCDSDGRAWNSNAPPTAGSPGRRRSIFLTILQLERSMWTPMAICLSAAKDQHILLRSFEQCADWRPDTNLRPGNGGQSGWRTDFWRRNKSRRTRMDKLFLAIDHSGGPTNNNIYMLASVVPPGRSTTDVMFVRSTDGGQPLARRTRSMTIP